MKFNVCVNVHLDLEISVEADSYDAAIAVAKKDQQLVFNRIANICRSRYEVFNDFTIKPYGVFSDEKQS